MIWTRVLTSVSILAVSMLCVGQDTTSGGPDSIIAGPFGEPRMVMSEGGEWSYPIKVFANADVEAFVPDITSQGWISWHVAEFRRKGTYSSPASSPVSSPPAAETLEVEYSALVAVWSIHGGGESK